MAKGDTKTQNYLGVAASGTRADLQRNCGDTRTQSLIMDIAERIIEMEEHWAVIMPTASADNYGKIVQYVGETTSDYTKGFFYECVLPANPEYEASVKAPTRLKASVDTDTFAEAVSGIVGEYEFDYIGKPVGFLATYTNLAIYCERNATLDTGTAIGWTYTPPTGGAEQNYYTDTEYVNSSTKIYLDAAFENVAPYQMGSIDRSLDEGYWVMSGKETLTTLGDYGISVKESKAEVGDAIIVKLDSESSYYWDNIDVQPRG